MAISNAGYSLSDILYHQDHRNRDLSPRLGLCEVGQPSSSPLQGLVEDLYRSSSHCHKVFKRTNFELWRYASEQLVQCSCAMLLCNAIVPGNVHWLNGQFRRPRQSFLLPRQWGVWRRLTGRSCSALRSCHSKPTKVNIRIML